jgi:hypothetical protein
VIPGLTEGTRVEEQRLAELEGGRTIHLRVRVRTIADADGRLCALTATPFAVVVDDPRGRYAIPLPEDDSESGLGGLLNVLLDPLL